MRTRTMVMGILVSMLAAGLTGCTSAHGGSPAEKRSYVDSMAQTSLAAFFEENPALESRVRQAPGYGLFSKIGTNLVFFATEGGHGKVHNNITGRDTYMKVAGGGIGLGIGVTDYKMLMIFRTEYAMGDFIANGWVAEAEAEVAAKTGDTGGESSAGVTAENDIETHIMTENGIAVSATVTGTKFWIDDYMN